MKLFVDDYRPAPDGWLLARTIDNAKVLLMRDDVEACSLDHDMGACDACTESGASVGDMRTPETTFMNWCPHVDDGHSLAVWMVQQGRVPPVVRVHSMNPIGSAKMREVFNRARVQP